VAVRLDRLPQRGSKRVFVFDDENGEGGHGISNSTTNHRSSNQ
jgi:hypothetical protein